MWLGGAYKFHFGLYYLYDLYCMYVACVLNGHDHGFVLVHHAIQI